MTVRFRALTWMNTWLVLEGVAVLLLVLTAVPGGMGVAVGVGLGLVGVGLAWLCWWLDVRLAIDGDAVRWPGHAVRLDRITACAEGNGILELTLEHDRRALVDLRRLRRSARRRALAAVRAAVRERARG